MSGASYSRYSNNFHSVKKSLSTDEETRKKIFHDRAETARASMGEKKGREDRDTNELYDRGLVKTKITKPAKGVKRIHLVLIDNSGSNRAIADKMKKDSGYLAAAMEAIDPQSQIAFVYFSDHGDGERMIQEIDFLTPGSQADKSLFSSARHIQNANGFDCPEAIECVLHEACQIDFNEAKEKHLYLVTDSVAHGMGYLEDSGCPNQCDWRQSLKEAKKVFSSFMVVGCSGNKEMGDLQKKFVDSNRVNFDFIDLSSIPEHEHRLGITNNALLFLIARHTGLQGVEMFLTAMYMKWLEDPVFGQRTDLRAKEVVERFLKYLEMPAPEIEAMKKRILV